MIFDKTSFPTKKLLQKSTTWQKISQETKIWQPLQIVWTDKNDSGTSIKGTPLGPK